MTLVPRYEGGARALWAGLACTGAGLLLSGIGFAVDPVETAWSWLFAYVLFAGLSVGALALLLTFHATRARWTVPLRRVLEAMALSSVLLIPLFLPVAFGLDALFPWHTPAEALGPKLLERIRHVTPWLNAPFFLARAAIYLGLWGAAAFVFDRWSRRQDLTADPSLADRLHRWSGITLVAVGLAFSFAVLDWVMSTDPLLDSTLFSFYVFTGGYLGALAVLCVVTVAGRSGDLFRGLLRPAHFHSLGKLLLGLVCFWAYLAFCQYMLVWIANEPEEVTYYLHRTKGAWQWVALFLPAGHFALPFFLLLSRKVSAHPGRLLSIAGWVLFAHSVDVYWTVLPTHHPAAPTLHWTLPAAALGMGGLFVAFVAWRLRGGFALPVGDPQLHLSLHYDPK